MAADLRVTQHNVQNYEQRNRDQELRRNRKPLHITAKDLESIRQTGNRILVGDIEGNALDDIHGTQRTQERIHLELCHNKSIATTDHHANQQCNDDGKPHIHTPVDNKHRHHAGAEV